MALLQHIVNLVLESWWYYLPYVMNAMLADSELKDIPVNIFISILFRVHEFQPEKVALGKNCQKNMSVLCKDEASKGFTCVIPTVLILKCIFSISGRHAISR